MFCALSMPQILVHSCLRAHCSLYLKQIVIPLLTHVVALTVTLQNSSYALKVKCCFLHESFPFLCMHYTLYLSYSICNHLPSSRLPMYLCITDTSPEAVSPLKLTDVCLGHFIHITVSGAKLFSFSPTFLISLFLANF